MKILIESSNAGYNWGDASMLHVAIQHIREQLPHATLLLLGEDTTGLASRYSSSVRSLPPESRQAWHRSRPIWHHFDRVAPNMVDHIVNHWPRLTDVMARAKMRMLRRDVEARDSFLRHFATADGLIVTGGGFITDAFQKGEEVLNTIQLAQRFNLPVVMFGQGIGPINSERLYQKAANSLPNIDHVAVREKRTSSSLLCDLGVDASRITVTGDDAVSLAYHERPENLGQGIGLNLRVAYYSGMGASSIDQVGQTVGEGARAFGAPLRPVPIAYDGHGSDVETIDLLLEAAGRVSSSEQTFDSLEDVIRQVGRCRIVVTGSYHGGVFALSQGIPVVALSNSAYYDTKFNGLADMFEVGCTMLRIDEPRFAEKLDHAIHHAWQQAPEIRPRLLEAARTQIDAADMAYARLPSIFT